jgi:uncharacterized protein YbjT (DUF2867 family)
MFAITGITGKVGGEVARVLLRAGRAVCAVVRDPRKGAGWKHLGCELAVADMNDAPALAEAFRAAAGVFVLLPPVFDPSPGFPETRATVAALWRALESARPAKVLCISTIGAHAKRTNLLTQLTLMEQALGNLPMPITFLRPAWFMENCSWDVASARETGSTPASCSRSTGRSRWFPPPTSAASRRNCFRKPGLAAASSNWKAQLA